jgi:hypothetical protein
MLTTLTLNQKQVDMQPLSRNVTVAFLWKNMWGFVTIFL